MYKEITEYPRPVRMWTENVPVEQGVFDQVRKLAHMGIVAPEGIAIMPDCHVGIGSTVGTVIPTVQAIIPAAVGVDIGCGICTVKTDIRAEQLPDSLLGIRTEIESVVPHGGPGEKGSWSERGYHQPAFVRDAWTDDTEGQSLNDRYKIIVDKHPKVSNKYKQVHLGSLGTGNHFVEVCLDKEGSVWIMLHSGSRGVGNRIGEYFISLAKEDMKDSLYLVSDVDLCYLQEGTEHFNDYVEAVTFAQDYARVNRELMMRNVLVALKKHLGRFNADLMAVNCHHNYVQKETHFGKDMFVTRKGAVSAKSGELGIIPGSMGARSFIVRGLGNEQAFTSCSHGAGRRMSRNQAKKTFTLDDHRKATEGVECRKDRDVIDETPAAYKDIDVVMAAQADLVEIVAELKQVLCVKG